jgi:hypothetical protein
MFSACKKPVDCKAGDTKEGYTCIDGKWEAVPNDTTHTPPVEPPIEPPVDPYEEARKSCQEKETNKSTKDSVYTFDEVTGKCIGQYFPKRDTIVLWNTSTLTKAGKISGLGFIKRSDMLKILGMEGINEIFIRLEDFDQRLTSSASIYAQGDTLTALFNAGIIKIHKDKDSIYQLMLISATPSPYRVEQYRKLGIFLMNYDDYMDSIEGISNLDIQTIEQINKSQRLNIGDDGIYTSTIYQKQDLYNKFIVPKEIAMLGVTSRYVATKGKRFRLHKQYA